MQHRRFAPRRSVRTDVLPLYVDFQTTRLLSSPQGAAHRDCGAADYLVDAGVAGAERGGAVYLEGVIVVRGGVVLQK